MPTYRIYLLAPDDRIRAGDYAECSDDQDALAKGREMLGEASAVEIWEGKRYVATLRAEQAASSGPPS